MSKRLEVNQEVKVHGFLGIIEEISYGVSDKYSVIYMDCSFKFQSEWFSISQIQGVK